MTITRHAVAARMTLPAYWSPVSAVPVFADGFQSGVSAWTPQANTARTGVVNPATGLTEMRVAYAYVSGGLLGQVTWSSVATVIGKSYRAVATIYGAAPAYARVSASPSGPPSTGGGWVALQASPQSVSYTFTATSAATFIAIAVGDGSSFSGGAPAGPAAVAYVQQVAVYDMEQRTTLDLAPERATVTLDESWSPFVRASITCPIPATDALDKIDPRSTGAPDYQQPQRVQLTMTQTDTDSKTVAYVTATWSAGTAATFTTLFAGQTVAYLTDLWGDAYNPVVNPGLTQSRELDLMLRTREIDWLAGTMTLDCASDEMLLQDLARYDVSTSDQRPPNTTSLRMLVQWVLNLIGTSLAPSSVDDAVIDSAAVIWNLGESAWSFLDAFVRTNALRLYCNELRQWQLGPPVTGASGTLPLSSVTSLRDVLSREDSAYGNGAVVVYEWTDTLGARQRQYQFAFVPGTPAPKIVTQKFTTPNPNLAAAPASALLTRSVTRGRDVQIEALSDYRADPGQAVILTTPVTAVAGTMVSAVTWRFPEDRMDISTRDTTA